MESGFELMTSVKSSVVSKIEAFKIIDDLTLN
jgi:hypothetical protein